MLQFPFFTWYRAQNPLRPSLPPPVLLSQGPTTRFPHAVTFPSPSSPPPLLLPISALSRRRVPLISPPRPLRPRISRGFPRRRGFPADSPAAADFPRIPVAACPPSPRDLFVADSPAAADSPRIPVAACPPSLPDLFVADFPRISR
ncbi:unnamed protein product [Closterium sp. NIES-54]